MKELSVEEKAKRYDKAIERAKEMINDMTNIGGVAKVDDIQYLFPELKESEGEKIRKEIIAFLTYYHTGQGNSVKYDDGWIAWLEKQGNDNKEYWRGYREGKQEILDKYAELEKQGEQKPAWSEEDSPYYDDICEMLINLLHSETADVNKGAVQKDLDWLMSLKPQSTWKPSDEQMITLRHVISGCSYDIEPLVELETKLKEL